MATIQDLSSQKSNVIPIRRSDNPETAPELSDDRISGSGSEPTTDYFTTLFSFPPPNWETSQEVDSPRSGGRGGGGMEARVARLESDVEHIKSDISEIKSDIKDIGKTIVRIDQRFPELKTWFVLTAIALVATVMGIIFAVMQYTKS